MSSTFKSLQPQLAWDNDGLPSSTTFDDIYYSSGDARDESRYVFLQGTELAATWSEPGPERGQFTICELGFGGGLNFLMTWQLWDEALSIGERHSSRRQLHYIAIEKYPISANQLKELHKKWPELAAYSEHFLQQYRSDYRGLQRIKLAEDLTLDLVIDDAQHWLSKRSQTNPGVDAWYLDGFSPSKNPQLWSKDICQLLAQHSSRKTKLATYSSAGDVRRNLEAAGFDVQRKSGFANKRHMLIGCGVNTEQEIPKSDTPWFSFTRTGTIDQPSNTVPQTVAGTKKSAIIIGAGLAGCFTANALANRGWQVTALDKADSCASAASGIRQLALRCRLFNAVNSHSHFYAQAFLYALTTLQRLNSAEQEVFYDCGVLQKSNAINSNSGPDGGRISEIYPESIVHCDEQGDFSFAKGGWVDSAKACESLLNHSGIRFIAKSEVHALARQGSDWQAYDASQNLLASADVVVVANAQQATTLVQSEHLPLETSHGQSSEFSANSIPVLVDKVVCGKKSVFPALNGTHTVSASYRSGAEVCEIRNEDNVTNQKSLEQILQLQPDSAKLIASSVATRCNTRDRFPIVGPAPDNKAIARNFAELRRNANAQPQSTAEHLAGLYLNIGHGSNGLVSCPLSGEYLASLINGDSIPLDQEIMNALNPVRFQIQNMKKQRH